MTPRFLLLTLVLLSASCVRVDEKNDPWRRNTYITTRDRDGVRVHVQSVKNQRFTVQYRDRRNPQEAWADLPGAFQVIGNGETMMFADPSPESRHRSYRVLTLLGLQPDQMRRSLP